ncbi:hypothetical protein, partial [Novipirellula artificiosorum]
QKCEADRRRKLAATSNSDQLREFLERCNRRGSPYRAGRNQFPTQTQLAKYCQCDESTIYRISTGEQMSVRNEVSDILLAVSCISPRPAWDDVTGERLLRLADADACVDNSPASRSEVLDAILSGIALRLETQSLMN